MRKLKVIVSIDGGGIRGILPLCVLNYLNEEVQKRRIATSINEPINLYAGTSTGAIISSAMMLESKGRFLYEPHQLLQLYASRGEQIFKKNRDRNENSLKLILDANFGDISLKELKKCYLFSSYDERSNAPFVFTSRLEHFRNVSVAKMLLACSSVREYFPPVELGGHLLSDGINAAKNMSLMAYEHAKAYYPNDLILLLSLGTGKLPLSHFDEIEKASERTHQTLLEHSKEVDDLIYYRMQPTLINAEPDMDDTSQKNIQALLRDGRMFVESQKERLAQLINQFEELVV